MRLMPHRSAPQLRQHVDLTALNTFGVAAKAAYFCAVHSPEDLRGALAAPRVQALPLLVLGGGSNVLLTRDFPGLVLHIRLLGKRVLESSNDAAHVEAAAGENWHAFVQWTLAQGYAGLENLSLIPGYVGASPMQNIGAYGVEMKDCFASLDALDLQSGEVRSFDERACEFGYRDSIFKHAASARYVILSVRFRLQRSAELHLDYGDIRNELARLAITQPTADDVGAAVCNIRQRKLPDPAVIGNAGSFFKNPILADTRADLLAQQYPAMPRYPAGAGHSKLAAGWLIEQAGWKGRRLGNAGVHAQHALVLVNHGGASGAEILTLARTIQHSVAEKFGVELEPEPVIV
jgi:UDP-N-acetylmuramate dehydrogenase